MFFDDARAVADWDAQFDPIVPLERRDRQEVDAVRHEPAGVLRELQRCQERRDVLRAGSRRRLLSCFVCFWCRGAQCSIYWASPGRRCLRRWALARAPAGAGRGSDAVVLRVHELSEEHSLVIFGSIT